MSYVIASLPGRGQLNAYVDQFYDALRPHGIVLYAEPELTRKWADEHFNKIDALHFHWPEYIWLAGLDDALDKPTTWKRWRQTLPGAWRIHGILQRVSRLRTSRNAQRRKTRLQSVERFINYIDMARTAGISVVWTAHNLESHEEWDDVDQRGFSLLADRADVIICHSESARREFGLRYGNGGKIVVMPLGNYDGVYPPPRPRESVLAVLGLRSDRPVVGCIGAIRSYKGIDLAIEAVTGLDGQVQLVCAGQPRKMGGFLSSFGPSGPGPGIALVPRALSEQEFADYCAACDLLLLPYKRITGSAALLAALTLGRAVIASDLPYFREVLRGDSAAGRLIPVGDSAALARAIVEMLRVDSVSRTSAARALADEYAWPKIVTPVVEAIRNVDMRRARKLSGTSELTP